MKISIITVCYNSEATIKDTLESVLKQTYTNYEYLIIDGKSKDNTINIVKEYEKKFTGKLKWISERDKGLYNAMNKGISLATGDIIGIINSDDILAHEKVLERVVEVINGVDGVYSNLLMLDENLKEPYRLFNSKNVSKRIGWHMPHPTLYVKKEIYEKYGTYNEEFRIAADLDFMYRIIKQNTSFKYVNDCFVFMRSGGASTGGLKGYYKNFQESYRVLKKNHIAFPFLTNIKRTIDNVFLQKLKSNNTKKIEKLRKELGKKRLVQINTVCNGSTGKIMRDIQRKANEEGYQTLSIYGRRKGYKDLECKKVGGFFSFWLHVGITTLCDLQGHGSYFKTKKIVRILKKENPDVIHLHNIHGYYLNYKVLFKYLKNKFTGKLFWTFHDCWPFTGHCPHFVVANCLKWQTECYHCPNKKQYPISLFWDASKSNYNLKKELFTGLKNLTIVTPSDWLNDLVKKSFLKEYPRITINNWIDRNIFKPTKNENILKKYNISNNKKIILGVANIWDERKGLAIFKEIAKNIENKYKIVLVGLSKKQIKYLPENIIGIERTENQSELAVIYTRADVFINPSKEETFSLTTLEAIACATPAIVLKTSAVQELINEKNGMILKIDTIEGYLNAIKKIENFKIDEKELKEYFSKYDKDLQTTKYLDCYQRK